MWLGYILSELNLAKDDSVTIYVDNNSALSLAKNLVSHSRNKLINIKYHFIREHVNDKIMELVQCRCDKTLSDIFTKPLKPDTFKKMKIMLGMQSPV